MVVTEERTTERLLGMVEEFIEAMNARDVERVLAHFTPQTVWRVPALPLMSGQREVGEYLRSIWTAFPDFHLDDVRIFISPDGEEGAARFHLTATMEGRMDPPGLRPTHAKVSIPGVCLYRFHDGKIDHHTIVYDSVDLLRQMKAMPAGTGIARLFNRLMTIRR